MITTECNTESEASKCSFHHFASCTWVKVSLFREHTPASQLACSDSWDNSPLLAGPHYLLDPRSCPLHSILSSTKLVFPVTCALHTLVPSHIQCQEVLQLLSILQTQQRGHLPVKTALLSTRLSIMPPATPGESSVPRDGLDPAHIAIAVSPCGQFPLYRPVSPAVPQAPLGTSSYSFCIWNPGHNVRQNRHTESLSSTP